MCVIQVSLFMYVVFYEKLRTVSTITSCFAPLYLAPYFLMALNMSFSCTAVTTVQLWYTAGMVEPK